MRRARRPLIVSHADPDPDSLGSALGLAAICRALGADPVTAVSRPDVIDSVMAAIPGVDGVRPLERRLLDEPPAGRRFDALVCVDTATPALLTSDDDLRAALFEVRPRVNVDHHVSNTCYGDVNYVDAAAAAAAEVVWLLLTTLGVEIPPEGAVALQAGLVADTLGFQIESTGPRTLRAAADLARRGGATSGVPRHVLTTQTFEASRLLGAALAAVQRSADGRLVWTTVSASMARAAGARMTDSQGIPTALQEIEGAVAAVAFYELAPGCTRVSLRSRGPRIDDVAAAFGGGGHALAAGARVDAPLDVVAEQVIERLRGVLAERASAPSA